MFESLVEESEVVGEARPPRKVARILVFHWCCDGSILLKHVGAGGPMIVCVRLECDGPMVEEFS